MDLIEEKLISSLQNKIKIFREFIEKEDENEILFLNRYEEIGKVQNYYVLVDREGSQFFNSYDELLEILCIDLNKLEDIKITKGIDPYNRYLSNIRKMLKNKIFLQNGQEVAFFDYDRECICIYHIIEKSVSEEAEYFNFVACREIDIKSGHGIALMRDIQKCGDYDFYGELPPK